MNQNNHNQFKGMFLFLFVLLLSTIHFNSGPGSSGNVEQWVNLTNETFYGHQDFLFSYGPLYWITGGATSQYSAASYWAAVVFLSALYAIFWTTTIWMASEARTILLFSGVFLLFFQSLTFSPALFLWPFVLVIYLDLHRQENISIKGYFFWGALIALAFYIRFFWGIVALATLGTYFASRAIVDKKVGGIISLFAGLIFSYIIIGLIVFHDYDSIVNYVIINNQLSFGNSVDMTLNIANKPQTWVAAALSALALNVYAFIRKRQFLLTINILILIFLKLGFSRTDHYLGYFVGPVAVLTLLPLLDRSIVGRGAFLVSAGSLYYLLTFPSYPNAPVKNMFQPGVDFKIDYASRMQETYKHFRLSSDLLNAIGSGSIDVYPYNNEYVFANKLNYRHRPIFQSYMTLTPKLDSMNQAFFQSSERPQFILWTAGIGCASSDCNPFESFDEKYSLNEDPLTTSSIFLNYHKVKIGEGKDKLPLILLEKNKSEKKYSEVFIRNERFEFGKWYSVPMAEGGLLKVKPEFKIALQGKMKNLLFRGDVLKIKYQLPSGEIKEYRLNILNSSSGIVVSPLLDSFDLTGLRPTRIMFETSSRWYFEPLFNAKWVTIPDAAFKIRNPYFDARSNISPEYGQEKNIHCEGSIDSINGEHFSDRLPDVPEGMTVHGWLAYSTRNGELYDKTYLVLTDSKGEKSFISTRKENREDVSAAFHNAILKNSGFVSNVDTSFLDGKSTLSLAAVKGSTLYKCDQFEATLQPKQ